jgi:SAM-dependent methyltransferase
MLPILSVPRHDPGAAVTDQEQQRTTLPPEETGGLGTLTAEHPEGTFAPSPATRVTVRAIGGAAQDLEGIGFDWGCGVGLLAVAAALSSGVTSVTGLDISPTNVMAARKNAALNGVDMKTSFFEADSFAPVSEGGRRHLSDLRGAGSFLVANPPASTTGDGFDFRRLALRDARSFLRPGAVVLVQALSVYGPGRVEGLAEEPGGYAYDGIALRTPVVALDMGGRQMRGQLETYVRAEQEGARPYEFLADPAGAVGISAAEASRHLLEGNGTFYARWQVHRFQRSG